MKKFMNLKRKQIITGYVFVLPWIIGFVMFFGNNFVQTIRYSLNKVSIDPTGGYSLSFIGLDNFKNALTSHASFNRIITESVGSILIDVPLIIFFSLFMSILINQKFKGRALIRAILFLPVIMATSAIMHAMDSSLAQIMGGISNVSVMQSSQNTQTVGLNAGYLMEFLIDFGMPENIITYIVGAISRIYEIVRASGVQILIFLAALQAIPPALYEVSKVEGATGYETFWKITFPMVSPLIVTNMVYTIVDLYSRADIIELASNTAFSEMNFGLSSAMSLLSSLCISIILIVSTYLVSKKVFYQN